MIRKPSDYVCLNKEDTACLKDVSVCKSAWKMLGDAEFCRFYGIYLRISAIGKIER